MVALSLKIGVGNVVKTMQFEPSTMVYDACRIIRERVPEAQLGQREFPPHTHTHTLQVLRCIRSSCQMVEKLQIPLPSIPSQHRNLEGGLCFSNHTRVTQ